MSVAELPKTDARHEPMDAETYHAHPAIGASMLEDFRTSRRLYEGRYVTKTIPKKAATPAMEYGTLLHTRLLEPERYFASLAPPAPELAPDGKKWLRRKDSDHEKWWNEYLESVKGKWVVDNDQRAEIEAIAASVLSKRHAKRLVEADGEPEYSIFWHEPEYGLDCKCRVDWFSRISLDFKTCVHPAPYAYVRQVVNLGYHRKLAHYKEGLCNLLNQKDAKLIHIAIGREQPYSVGAYNIDDRDDSGLSLGFQQRRRALREIAECYASGDWSDPWEHEIIDLKLPPCAHSEDAYNVG